MVGFPGGSGRWVQTRNERDAELFIEERRMRERERRSGTRPQLSATARRRLARAACIAAAVAALVVLVVVAL